MVNGKIEFVTISNYGCTRTRKLNKASELYRIRGISIWQQEQWPWFRIFSKCFNRTAVALYKIATLGNLSVIGHGWIRVIRINRMIKFYQPCHLDSAHRSHLQRAYAFFLPWRCLISFLHRPFYSQTKAEKIGNNRKIHYIICETQNYIVSMMRWFW